MTIKELAQAGALNLISEIGEQIKDRRDVQYKNLGQLAFESGRKSGFNEGIDALISALTPQ